MGFARATGQIFGWVNSDDTLLPGALEAIAEAYEPGRAMLYGGKVEEFDDDGPLRVVDQSALEFRNMVRYWARSGTWHQPGILFSRSVYERSGPLDTGLTCAFDYAFFCDALGYARVRRINRVLARFRLHSGSKTMNLRPDFICEGLEASRRFWGTARVRDGWRAYVYSALRLAATSASLLSKLHLRAALRCGRAGLATGLAALARR